MCCFAMVLEVWENLSYFTFFNVVSYWGLSQISKSDVSSNYGFDIPQNKLNREMQGF